MLNYKISKVADQFLQSKGGSCDYNFQGTDYKITPEFLEKASRELQQSFGGYASKNSPKGGGGGEGEGDGGTPSQLKPKEEQEESDNNKGGSVRKAAKINNTEVQRQNEVKKHILRWANTEITLDGPLNYPKVFKALLTEPHTAFDFRKKIIETQTNLTLFVDDSVGYHQKERWLHNTIIKVASKIKGVYVFHSHGLHNIEYKGIKHPYYTSLIPELPAKLKQKIVVFTQGCGGSVEKPYEGLDIKLHFCTMFGHKQNCGCSQIRKAENSGKAEMHYNIETVESLAKLKF